MEYEDLREISTYEEAMNAWDHSSVLVRGEPSSDGGEVVYVYPQIPRGYIYPNFSLRHEVCLQTFRSKDLAVMWAQSQGMGATIIR